jgi:hypothetical protein
MYRLADLALTYAEAIDFLNQLGSYNTALEKLNFCLKAAANMKTSGLLLEGPRGAEFNGRRAADLDLHHSRV